MYLHVTFQDTPLVETLTTHHTNVWFETCVNQVMSLEVYGQPKPSLTYIARIRLIACVNDLVGS